MIAADFAARAERLRLIGFDVDGVLTDGRLIYGESESKAFHARDGLGLKLLQLAGIRIVVISARHSEATARRLRELGIQDVALGVTQKLTSFEAMLESAGIAFDEAAFMGDDVPDLPILRRVGLAATVVEASAAIHVPCHFVATRPAGMGAVREFIDAVLHARGQLDALIERAL